MSLQNIFLKFIYLCFILSSIHCGGNPISNPTTPRRQIPTPTTTTQSSSIIFSGEMNLQDKSIYRDILAQSGICFESGWSGGSWTGAIGNQACSNLEVNPRIQVIFTNNKTNVQELQIFPQYERRFFSGGGQVAFPITLTSVDQRIHPINDSEGWEIRFYSKSEISNSLSPGYSGYNTSRFEVRLRCEYCDIEDNEFEDIDIYKGIYSDGIRFGNISDLVQGEP